MREWQTGCVRIGKVYRVQARDLGRVGHCWMRGRLLVGDLVTPTRLSGDGFYDWRLVEGGEQANHKWGGGANYGRWCYSSPDVTFGAYCMGTLHNEQPTEREWHLLMAGESVAFTGVAQCNT